MNALRITLWAGTPLTLPLAYNHILQGAIYSAWEESVPQLHDAGFSAGGPTFRMFTFSPLRGRYEIKEKNISFTGPMTFEVRSPVPDLLQVLADHLLAGQAVRLGHQVLPVVNIQTADRLLFPASADIRMISPVTVHRTLDDGTTVYYAPSDEEFPLLLAENLASKIKASHLPLESVLGILPYPGSIRKRVTTFKGIYITGYTGRFRLEAEPETMAFLYCTGLGARNSQGFGMFSIENKPLR